MQIRNSEQEDYLVRIIRQIGEAIARMRELLTASASAGPAIRSQIPQAIELLLGERAALLARLDADSAARLVESRHRVELWAKLLELDADACASGNDTMLAAGLRARAAALRTAAVRL